MSKKKKKDKSPEAVETQRTRNVRRVERDNDQVRTFMSSIESHRSHLDG